MTSVQSFAELNALIRQVRDAASSLRKRDLVSTTLVYLAQVLREETDTILEANTLDLEASLEMALPELVLDWLKLTPERLKATIKIIEHLAQLRDSHYFPCSSHLAVPPTAHAYALGEPLGVVAFVYEALPELAIIAAALCLHTGNGLLLKGGHEASQTNQAIARVFQAAMEKASLAEHTILFVSPSEGEAVRRWLMQTSELDLIIPYGRSSLVQQVVKEATALSLPTVIGNCYLYWAKSAPVEVVTKIVLDSHRGLPEAVNSIEKILVDSHIPSETIARLQSQLRAANMIVHDAWPSPLHNSLESHEKWRQAHFDRSVVVHRVATLSEGISLINRYSHGHADCIVTNSYQESVLFAQQVRSASIYTNTSPRFYRDDGRAEAIALGMSPKRGIYGGRVGLGTLLTQKTIVQDFTPPRLD